MEEFIREKYYPELLKASKEESALVIDFSDLDKFDPVTADMVLESPKEVMEMMQKAVETFGLGGRMHVRVRNLPESRNIRIRNLRAVHMNRLWCVDAIIKAASEVKPQIYDATFACPECGTKQAVPQEGNLLQKAFACQCGRRGDFGDPVEKKMFDVRWLTGVEPFEITTGEQPGEIRIILKEDLTTPKMQKKTDPGARLHITGMLIEAPKHIKGRLSTKMDMFFEAVHVETKDTEFDEMDITSEDEKKILDLSTDPNVYERLKMSIAPGIYGFEEIKESIALQLFGGIKHILPDGNMIRGNIHILLTGDPGIGKTQFLKLISNIVPRGKYVSGSGVTGAGLTATVRKDEVLGGWVLEAGALILANKGVISIDEFDKMGRDDQIAMHEGMSIETVSIAKASIVATLPAETAVLAGANPKFGRVDPYMPIADQITIPETLLSRFDLKFALRDKPDRTQDEKLADHIIMSRTKPELVEPAIDMGLLRKYIAYAKRINHIELSHEASQRLKDFYVDMRNRYTDDANTISITLRQYEALIRMAEASAKIRLDTRIREEDADRAIRLMKYSLSQLGYDYETGRIDIDRVEGGVPAGKRKKIHQVIEIIENLQKSMKEVPTEDVKAAAEEQGIENSDEIIEKLKSEGTLFEPRIGFIKKAR